jgi:hypothetical protein
VCDACTCACLCLRVRACRSSSAMASRFTCSISSTKRTRRSRTSNWAAGARILSPPLRLCYSCPPVPPSPCPCLPLTLAHTYTSVPFLPSHHHQPSRRRHHHPPHPIHSSLLVPGVLTLSIRAKSSTRPHSPPLSPLSLMIFPFLVPYAHVHTPRLPPPCIALTCSYPFSFPSLSLSLSLSLFLSLSQPL